MAHKQTKTLVSFEIWDKEAGATERHSLKRHVVDGDEDGPHTVITAGIHGDEFLGIDAAKQVYRELDEDRVKGTVSIIPEANMFAVSRGVRDTPVPDFELYEDEERNLNRCFNRVDSDGEEGGNITERLAHHILQLVEDADYCLDLHTATQPGYKLDQIREKISRGFDDEVLEKQEKLVRNSGVEYVVKTPEGRIGEGLLAAEAPASGVPAVTVEIGGGIYTDAELEGYVNVVMNLLRTAGNLPGDPETREQKVYRDLMKISAPAAGEYEKSVRQGDEVSPGDVIAEIENEDGTLAVESPYEGVVESVHRREWVNEGTKLGHIAVREERHPLIDFFTDLSQTLKTVIARVRTPS